MMRKRLPLALLLAFPLSVGFWAQETQSPSILSALNADVTTLFTSIGRDVTPRLYQMAMSGNDLVGEARIGGFTRVTLSVAGLSLTTMDGIARVLGSSDPELWKFSLVSLPSAIQGGLSFAGSMAADGFSMATGAAFGLPNLRFGIGLPLPFGLEFLGNGFYLSRSILEQVTQTAGLSLPVDLDGLGVELEMLTAGGILRKTIFSEARGLLWPSVSIGASYTYSKFDFAVDNFSLGALGMDPYPVSGLGTLELDGNLGFHTEVQSYGVVFHVSKTLLWFMTPFAKAGAYYHVSDYRSAFNVTATITPTPTDPPAVPAPDPITQSLDAPVILHEENISLIASAGLEVKILPVTLTVCASLDLDRPVVEFTAPVLNGFKVNGLGVTAALRIQI
jgi:hypothetical protein